MLAENSFASAATNRIIGSIYIALKKYSAALTILELVLQKCISSSFNLFPNISVTSIYVTKFGRDSPKVTEIENTISKIRSIAHEERDEQSNQSNSEEHELEDATEHLKIKEEFVVEHATTDDKELQNDLDDMQSAIDDLGLSLLSLLECFLTLLFRKFRSRK